MRRTAVVLAVLAGLLAMAGCVSSLPEFEGAEEAMLRRELVEVRFDVAEINSLKSAISPAEEGIYDMNLYAYSEGRLVASEYYCKDLAPSLKLLYGQSYNLYAIANVGMYEAPEDESQFCSQCKFQITRVHDMRELLPMSWMSEGFILDTIYERVNIRFERLVSKVVFSVDKSALKGLEINYMRLRQSPRVVWPFKYEEGSRVMDESEVFDCDYATSVDLDAVNSGGQVHFYVLENCQGRLLEGNVDPWAKVPENLQGEAGLCTYLEIGAAFKNGFFYSGDVKYRLYLGQDSVSDFNIKRNTVLNASLYLTDDALGQVSWRVESDVEINDGYAGGWISRGMHAVDDLYIGERFIYSIVLEEEMMTHLDGDLSAANLCVIGEDGQIADLMQFGGFEDVEIVGSSGRFDVEALCINAGYGTICLLDENDRKLAEFERCFVQKPFLLATESIPEGELQEIIPDVPQIEFDINDRYYDCSLYFVDKEGYNLNNRAGVGFETSLFDLNLEVEGIDAEIFENLDFKIVDGDHFDDCFAVFNGRCHNDGENKEVSLKLMEYVTGGKCLNLKFIERNYGIVNSLQSYLGCMPVTMTLVDNGWAGYADCQLSMVVDNPSSLPLKVRCWQLNRSTDSYDGITRSKIVNLCGVDFKHKTYDYVCGQYHAGSPSFYCSGSEFNAYRSGVFPMPELSTELIYYALLYDYKGQGALLHQIDVTFEDGSLIGDLKAVNMLSDGSSKYDLIYGSVAEGSGWNDRGLWLYTAKRLLSEDGVELDDFKGVDPISLTELSNLSNEYISVAYNADTQNIIASVNSSRLDGLLLNTEVVIKASGYVQTTPNGTWGKKVDNYCSATVSKTVSNLSLGMSFVPIDGNAIKEAMNAIYAQKFADSYNAIGSSKSYEHSAHPTSLEISLRFALGGEYADSMIPITVTSPTSIPFYHSQDDVSYSVSISTIKKINKIGLVENLRK